MVENFDETLSEIKCKIRHGFNEEHFMKRLGDVFIIQHNRIKFIRQTKLTEEEEMIAALVSTPGAKTAVGFDHLRGGYKVHVVNKNTFVSRADRIQAVTKPIKFYKELTDESND